MCESHEALNIKIAQMQKESERAREDINKRLDNISNDVSSIGKSLTDFILKVETKFVTVEDADKKFASKLTEKMVYSTAGMMLTAIIGGLIYLIINH